VCVCVCVCVCVALMHRRNSFSHGFVCATACCWWFFVFSSSFSSLFSLSFSCDPFRRPSFLTIELCIIFCTIFFKSSYLLLKCDDCINARRRQQMTAWNACEERRFPSSFSSPLVRQWFSFPCTCPSKSSHEIAKHRQTDRLTHTHTHTHTHTRHDRTKREGKWRHRSFTHSDDRRTHIWWGTVRTSRREGSWRREWRKQLRRRNERETEFFTRLTFQKPKKLMDGLMLKCGKIFNFWVCACLLVFEGLSSISIDHAYSVDQRMSFDRARMRLPPFGGAFFCQAPL